MKVANYGYCRRIKVKEVQGVICSVCWGRMADPEKILMDFYKSIYGGSMEWPTKSLDVSRRQRCPKRNN